jgi:hypothetical protein
MDLVSGFRAVTSHDSLDDSHLEPVGGRRLVPRGCVPGRGPHQGRVWWRGAGPAPPPARVRELEPLARSALIRLSTLSRNRSWSCLLSGAPRGYRSTSLGAVTACVNAACRAPCTATLLVLYTAVSALTHIVATRWHHSARTVRAGFRSRGQGCRPSSHNPERARK